MYTTELNNVSRKLETAKFKLFEVLQEIENLEKEVNDLKSKTNNNEEIEKIPRSNFTTITKTEAEEKIKEDKTETSKIIMDKEKSNRETELILVASLGSLIKSRSRISTATAIIFAEI